MSQTLGIPCSKDIWSFLAAFECVLYGNPDSFEHKSFQLESECRKQSVFFSRIFV
jgi:hypothetical protein